MADHEEEDLRMALRMSLHSPPEPKRSKPAEGTQNLPTPQEFPEARARREQRELMAAAAERRILSSPVKVEKKAVSVPVPVPVPVWVEKKDSAVPVVREKEQVAERKVGLSSSSGGGEELSPNDANQLFTMVFGSAVSKEILSQWTNQGIRFSSDPETCMGLVQHEGGPCGVLATIQAFVLKYLLFFPDGLGKNNANLPSKNLNASRFSQSESATLDSFASLTEDGKSRALIRSMAEILFMCGSKKRAVIATLILPGIHLESSEDGQNDEIITKALEGVPFDSASDLQKLLRVDAYITHKNACHQLKDMLPLFRSRFGALLFLISALLSRELDSVQLDRDDPSLPLVTAPFGHASQEIVNLLLCGQAVPNVFDGRMDLGGGMFLKGIPSNVEVGFLTLLEFLNFCRVGQNLKCPKWPIWVVGSESHYTVLFAFDSRVQDANELEERESKIRKAFDAQDQSGGGGFISVEGLNQVLRETNINLPQQKLDHLCSMGFIVWSEFWQVLLELDKNQGGMKDSTGLMGRKLFDLYHFNGIAKSILNGSQNTAGGESPLQRPRLSKLRVSVSPRWTPEEFMAYMPPSSGNGDGPSEKDAVVEITRAEPPQHAPLVDCIRTRWARAVCNWFGDPPSIV